MVTMYKLYNNINMFIILFFPQLISKLSLRSTRKTIQKLKSSAPKKEKGLYGPGWWVQGTHPHPSSHISTHIASVPKVSLVDHGKKTLYDIIRRVVFVNMLFYILIDFISSGVLADFRNGNLRENLVVNNKTFATISARISVPKTINFNIVAWCTSYYYY